MFINLLVRNHPKVIFYNNVRNTRYLQCNVVRPQDASMGDTSLSNKLVQSMQDEPDCAIFSFEDLSVGLFTTLVHQIKRSLMPSTVVVCGIVIRDVLNVMSSRLKANMSTPVNHGVVALWKEHFYDHTFPKLNYNRFLTDEDYRDSLKATWMLSDVEPVRTVPQFLSGSSFAPGSLAPDESHRTASRYHEFLSHPCICSVLADEELLGRLRDSFGMSFAVTRDNGAQTPPGA